MSFLIFGSGSVVLVLFRRCVNSITATSVLQCQMTHQDRCRDNYRPCFTLRLRGAGGGAGTSIPRPFILNPHVFDDGGHVVKHAKKGKLISLIDSDNLYCVQVCYNASTSTRRGVYSQGGAERS